MEATCPCGARFEAKSKLAIYCSPACRVRQYRAKAKADVIAIRKPETTNHPIPRAADDVGGVERTTRKVLEDADRLETPQGQACLVLARRMDTPGMDTGSALQSVAARLDELLTKVTRGTAARSGPDQLRDELADWRASKGGSA